MDGTSPAARGSIATAVRSARASPLKHDSEIWWSLVPYNVSTCSVTPAFIAKAWNHSCTSSVSNAPTLSRRELGLEHQERPPRNVDRDAGQRLVHRHVHARIAGDALHVAERLLHRLAERDADVLGGVVVVDVQVALGLHGDVDARVAREQVEHVIEEADAGRDLATRRCRRGSTATSTSVSLVFRFTAPLRMDGLVRRTIPKRCFDHRGWAPVFGRSSQKDCARASIRVPGCATTASVRR